MSYLKRTLPVVALAVVSLLLMAASAPHAIW